MTNFKFEVIEPNSDIETKFYNGEFDSEYADFIMKRCAGDRVIGNGDSLLDAMESMYLADEFIAHLELIS